MTFYANTQKQSLTRHSFAIGVVAKELLSNLLPANRIKECEAAFVAGCMHDAGKLTPSHQDWVIAPSAASENDAFSFEKYARHNEVSSLLFHVFEKKSHTKLNNACKDAIKHAIYWHHPKPNRQNYEDFKTFGGIYKKLPNSLKQQSFDDLGNNFVDFVTELADMYCDYYSTNDCILSHIFNKHPDLNNLNYSIPPAYKLSSTEQTLADYNEHINSNAFNDRVRSALITADRIISKLSPEELNLRIINKTLESLAKNELQLTSNLTADIESHLETFSDLKRAARQRETAQKLAANTECPVLSGPAGCGKTFISLEWARLKNAQKIFWICPRVQVCQGIFKDLIEHPYLNVEIYTGEFKLTNDWNNPTAEKDYCSANIVITTIDQIFSAILSHTNTDLLISMMNSHVVFDEFHEYINMPAFNILFAELVKCKTVQHTGTLLLVSATPHYYYLSELFQLKEHDVIKIESFNNSRYTINFNPIDEASDVNLLYSAQESGNTIVISNTAMTAQRSFSKNHNVENSILLHSKYKKSDKKDLFEKVYNSFKANGTREYNVLRAGPIVQAALNITCDYMISEMTAAEPFLQRLGRLDRFGQNTTINVYDITLPQSIQDGKCIGSSAKFLNEQNLLQSTIAWYRFLKDKDLSNVSITDMYNLYEEFHNSDLGKTAMEVDLLAAMKDSARLISNRVTDPYVIHKSKTKKSAGKITKNSLRGDSRYVQMAVCDIENINAIDIKDEYAYNIVDDDIDNLTISIDEITGYGESSKNLVSFMASKHHQIFTDKKKPYKDEFLLHNARDPLEPVFVSYTKTDLSNANMVSHDYAIYYAVCDKQPIGAICITKLLSLSE